MSVNNIPRDWSPIGLWKDEFSRTAHRGSKRTPGKSADVRDKLSDWQLVFLQSKANGCFYDVEKLLHFNWQWPTNTWFQERLVQRLKNTGDD